MENEKINQILSKIADLEFEICVWGSKNSQSNPGAVMNLRWMKKEVEKLKQQLSEIKIK
jgi:hypothetical protein